MTPLSDCLRVIRTARSLAAIDEALAAGYWPLIQRAEVCPPFEIWIGVYQDPRTGIVTSFSDQRFGPERDGLNKVLPWESYCAAPRDLPFAAYLLPIDLQIGETVWIEDLIEDYPDLSSPEKKRLTSSKAVWNGQDFKIVVHMNSHHAIFGRPGFSPWIQDLLGD